MKIEIEVPDEWGDALLYWHYHWADFNVCTMNGADLDSITDLVAAEFANRKGNADEVKTALAEKYGDPKKGTIR